MKSKFFYVALVLVILFTFSLQSNVEAKKSKELQDLNNQTEKFLKDSYNKKDEFKNINPQKLNKYLNTFIQNKKYNVHSGNLELEKVFGKKYKNQELIYIPIDNKDVSENLDYSFLVIQYQNGKYVNYLEYNFTGNDKNYTAHAKLYSNGKLYKVVHKQLNEDYFKTKTNKTLSSKLGLNKEANAAGFWSKFNSCLANQGIAGWAITLIGIACVPGCAVPFSPTCAACLVGSGLIAEGAITWCLGNSL